MLLNVQDYSLLHGYAIPAQRHFSYWYHRLWPANLYIHLYSPKRLHKI